MSIERITSKKNTPYSFVAFGVALNLFIVYILFPSDQIFNAARIFSIAFILLSMIDIYRNRKRTKQTYDKTAYHKKNPSPRDGFSLARSYVWSNKFHIMAATVGLILALTVIAQSMIVSSSYEQSAFNSYVENDDPTAFRMETVNLGQGDFDLWNTQLDQNINSLFSGAHIKPYKHYTEANVAFRILLSTALDFNLDAGARASHSLPITTRGIIPEILDLYSQLPSYQGLDLEAGSILILPPDIQVSSPLGTGTYFYPQDSFIESNSTHHTFKILVDEPIKTGLISVDDPYNFHNMTYSVNQVWQLTDEDLAYIKFNEIVTPHGFTEGSLYIDPDDAWSLADGLTLTEILGFKDPYIWGHVGFTTLMFVNLPQIVDYDLEDQKSDLDKSNNKLSAEHSQFVLSSLPVHFQFEKQYYLSSPLLTQVSEFVDSLSDLQRLILLFSLPLIVVSLFLLYFSTTSIENKKEKIFSQLKIRGTSPNQIRGMILLEVLFSAFIAAMISAFLATALASLLMKSSGILEFNNPSIPLSYPADLSWRIPALGMLISLSFHLGNLFKLPRVGIEDSMEANIQETPAWVKHNIDLMVFGISVVYWAAAFLLPLSYNVQEIIFDQFGQYMLIILLLGLPLITGRYFLQGLARLLLILRIRFDTLTMAIRNLNTNKDFTTKLVAVLTAAMILSFTGLLMTDTIDDRNNEMSQYSLGADIVVENIDYSDQLIFNALHVSGVEATTNVRYIQKILDYVDIPENADPEDYPHNNFYGINTSNFDQVAYWDPAYSKNTLTDLVDKLDGTNGFILPETHAEFLGLEVGDVYEFRYGRIINQKFDFKLVGTVDYFPRLMDQLPPILDNGEFDVKDLFMVTSLENLENVTKSMLVTPHGVQQDDSFVYVKTNGGDIREISNSINEALIELDENYEVHNYLDEETTVFDIVGDNREISSIQGKVTFLTLHAILIFTIIITLICIGFYSFVFLVQRHKEIGIYRALGMTRPQITKLIFYEIMIIILSSIGVGVVSGIFVAFVVFRVILGNTQYVTPPFELSIPVNTLLALSAIFVALGLMLSFIPAYNTTRKQTGNILRVV